IRHVTPRLTQRTSRPASPQQLISVAAYLPLKLFFFNDTPPTEIYTLSLHDALPIYVAILFPNSLRVSLEAWRVPRKVGYRGHNRSEEHTSELQSQSNLVCRLLLEKKNTPSFCCNSCMT